MAGPMVGPGSGNSTGDWFASNAPPPGASNPDYIASIKQWYKQYLGRDASDQEAAGWANNPNGIGTVEAAIRNSPEAQARAPQAGAAGGTSSGQGDPEGFRAAWFASGGKTVDDLKAFVAAHPEFGATITGSKGSKLTFPGGQAFQAVRSAGLNGGIGPAWDDLSSAGGDSGGASGGLASGALTAPYDKQFSLMSPQDFINSPFSQAALGQIQQAGERGAAAKGTLLTPGTQQAINQKSIDYLGDAYTQQANMDLGVQQGNYGIFKDNQDRPFDKLYQTSSLGLNALNNAANNASNYSTASQNNATNTGSAQATGTVAGNNATTGAIGDIANASLSAYQKWLAGRA